MPPLLADFTHARPCKPFCEKYLTLPRCMPHYAPLLLQIKSEFMTAYRLNFHKEINAQPIWMSEFHYP